MADTRLYTNLNFLREKEAMADEEQNFSVTKNTNFNDNTFTLLQRIYCQNISVSLHNLRKSPIFAKFNNANVHCHKENLTTLLQI